MCKIFLFFIIILNFTTGSFANENLNKVNNFLLDLKSFKANFMQFSSNGDSAEGIFYIQKPNKLKFEYTNPFKSNLTTNGKSTYYYDVEMDELTTIPTSKTPLLFLLEENKKLEDLDFEIVETKFENDKFLVKTISKKIDELEKQNITFVFDKNINQLIGIIIEDNSENKLEIEFFNTEINKTIDKKIFIFDNKKRNKLEKF